MKNKLNKDFYRYVLPSMVSMLLSGFYSMVDGVFVGNAVGSQALAAINLVYPVQACMNATAFGLGVGGAVLMSKNLGQENYEEADRAMGSTISVLLIAAAALMGIFWLTKDLCIQALGATGAIADYAHDYISIIILCGFLPVLGNGITPLIRNQGKTIEATMFMSSGLITNIILDYVFVFRMNLGLTGAALATVIAQGVVAAFNLSYLFRNYRNVFTWDGLKISFSRLKSMVRIGISPFGQTLIPSVIIVFTNWQCIRYGGDDALAVFSLLSYVLASVQLLLQGVGDGIQPLLSFYYGAGKRHEIHYLFKKGIISSILISLITAVCVSVFRAEVVMLFGLEGHVASQAQPALVITACAFLMVGITRCISAYFYAVEKTNVSSLLVYIEPCLFFPIALYTLPLFFELNGVWLAYPAAQLALAALCIALYIRVEHRANRSESAAVGSFEINLRNDAVKE